MLIFAAPLSDGRGVPSTLVPVTPPDRAATAPILAVHRCVRAVRWSLSAVLTMRWTVFTTVGAPPAIARAVPTYVNAAFMTEGAVFTYVNAVFAYDGAVLGDGGTVRTVRCTDSSRDRLAGSVVER